MSGSKAAQLAIWWRQTVARTIQPTIRLARPTDAAAIARMSRRYIENGLPWTWRAGRVVGHIAAVDSTVIVAEQQGLMAGFAIMQFGDELAGLCLLATYPQFRRQGIAARLASWLERTADTAGITAIHVEARESNAGAHGLYDALGFELTKRLPGYYSSQESAVRFEKRLRPKFELRHHRIWSPDTRI